ncbi:hypothetical protein [Streptomyces sp. HYC2]|uniref:hypothetical protein n=1 Tax=Streptomyces sp. HYC2 TaxID=2955207 RepID=UPI0024818538|nr:hypothetical protein [Streptomyces sp. HYC2]
MGTCVVCGTDLPTRRGPRARRYCSRACQAKAYRARQEQRTSHRAAAADEQRLAAEYDAVPSRQLADTLSLAAGRIAGALTAGQAADDHDLGILARIPVVLTARAHRAAALAGALPAPGAAPTVTVLHLATPPEPGRPSRDDSAPAPPRRHPTKTSRDDATPAHATTATELTTAAPAPRRPGSPHTSREDSAPLPTWDTTAIKPVPQRLPKKQVQAVIDAAELVRAPDYRDSHTWILRSGDTLIGYVVPSYGGTSRSGRNGWVSRLGGSSGPRCRSRDGAAADLAARWLRVVTAAPKRTLTGNN